MTIPSANNSTKRIVASPRAKKALREHRIDSARVQGSGPGGRIVEADVLRVLTAGDCDRGTQSMAAAGSKGTLSPMRRAIARSTSASAAEVPHFHLRAELDATALVQFREQLLDQVLADCGLRLSITDLLLRAQALALGDVARANCIWKDGCVINLTSVAVGLVVALDEGLLIPVIRHADQLELADLVRERGRLTALARSGRIGGEALAEAASSLSNLGHSRVDDFSAVILPPQSSMLSVGRLAVRPFVVDGQLCPRPTLRLALAVDHRVLDGAPAARFLDRIIEYLEQPALLVYRQSRRG